MNVLIIDNGTKHLNKLKELVKGHGIVIKPLFQKYDNSEAYDLIILSGGSRISVMDAPEVFADEISLIQTSNVPIIGICEGCEIIAFAYGSELALTDHKLKGIKRIEIIEPNILELPETMVVYEAHHFAVKKLGKELLPLARSNSGYEIIRHTKKPVFGLQFHPEMFVNKSTGDLIFNKIIQFVDSSKQSRLNTSPLI